MRLVMDTDVLVAGIRSPAGASAELLRRAITGRARLLASVPLFIECEAVATRTEHLAAAGARKEDVLTLLDTLAACVDIVHLHFLWRPQLRDPDDELMLEAAVNGRADAIVTFNRRDFVTAAQFGVAVIAPAEALKGD